MNKKISRVVSFYSLVVVLAVMALTASAIISSVYKSPGKQTQILTTGAANDLKVLDAEPISTLSMNDGGSGSASSIGTVTLQAGQATPAPAGTAYPCTSCPEASSATDIMICTDYCASPEPEPTPVLPPNPYPQCDTCRGNTYGTSDKMTMCPMMACRYVQ